MNTDKDGCSTCPTGQEQYEKFQFGIRTYYQYDYRSELTGNLMTGIYTSLEAARQSRDRFIENEKRKMVKV